MSEFPASDNKLKTFLPETGWREDGMFELYNRGKKLFQNFLWNLSFIKRIELQKDEHALAYMKKAKKEISEFEKKHLPNNLSEKEIEYLRIIYLLREELLSTVENALSVNCPFCQHWIFLSESNRCCEKKQQKYNDMVFFCSSFELGNTERILEDHGVESLDELKQLFQFDKFGRSACAYADAQQRINDLFEKLKRLAIL